jgi:hypothetical protein
MKEQILYKCHFCKTERAYKKESSYSGFYEFIVWFCFVCLKEAYFFQSPIDYLFLVPAVLFSLNKRFFKVWMCSICHSQLREKEALSAYD